MNAPIQASQGTGSPRGSDVNASASQADAWFPNYRFRNGQTLDRLRIHYATLGVPHRNANGEIDNAVLVLHWTAASGQALLSPDYMKALFDTGRPLDASRYYLIFPDGIGCGDSSKPSDGLKAKFPDYGYRDMVDIQHKLVTETLEIHHLRAILGMSMGGMNAWQWAEAYPDFMDGIMPVVCMPIKVSGRNLIWRHLVIQSILSDPEYRGGDYTGPTRGWVHGYQLLRMMIDGVPHLQGLAPDTAAADRFIAEVAEQAQPIDANDVLFSLKSSADYDPEPGLSKVKSKVFALNFGDDEFNPESLHVLERLIPEVNHGHFAVQPGNPRTFGHYTMAHPDLWSQHVQTFMDGLA